MSIYIVAPSSRDLQKKFYDWMLNMTENQAYQIYDCDFHKIDYWNKDDFLVSISANRAVYKSSYFSSEI